MSGFAESSAGGEIELSPESEVYEIVGNIMIKKDRVRAVDTLTQKKSNLNTRMDFLEKQVRSTSEKAIKLQKEILEMSKAKGEGDEES